jgi:hypothetical protein
VIVTDDDQARPEYPFFVVIASGAFVVIVSNEQQSDRDRCTSCMQGTSWADRLELVGDDGRDAAPQLLRYRLLHAR